MSQHREGVFHIAEISRYPEEGGIQVIVKGRGVLTYARRFGIGSCNEDRLAGNAVHEQAGTGLQVVEVDEAILGDEIDDAISLGHLHSNGEIVYGFGGEIDVDRLLWEDRIRRLVVDFNNMELGACCSADRKRENFGV